MLQLFPIIFVQPIISELAFEIRLHMYTISTCEDIGLGAVKSSYLGYVSYTHSDLVVVYCCDSKEMLETYLCYITLQ